MCAVEKLGSRSLTIFVDALDECDQTQVMNLISFFEKLCNHPRKVQVQLKICFSSRHYPFTSIPMAIEVTLEAEIGHMEDIEQYIMSKLRLGKSKQAELLRSGVLTKSCGNFHWAVLVVEIINYDYSRGGSFPTVRKRLDDMPLSLMSLFEISRTPGRNLGQLLICILFATRPLKLQEVYFAIQLGLGDESSSCWDQEFALDQREALVRNSSRGLTKVTRNNTPLVEFVHESVPDLLLSQYK